MTVGMVVVFWRDPAELAERPHAAVDRGAERAGSRVVAMAMTFAIISRHIDLSPGSMLALVGAVIGLVYRDTGSLALGAARRARRGHRLRDRERHPRLGLGLNAIMVTLAAYIWARGLALGFTHGDPIVVDSGAAGVMNATLGRLQRSTAPIVRRRLPRRLVRCSVDEARPLHLRDGRRPGRAPAARASTSRSTRRSSSC